MIKTDPETNSPFPVGIAARVVHEVNRALGQWGGEPDHYTWTDAPDEQRDRARARAQFVIDNPDIEVDTRDSNIPPDQRLRDTLSEAVVKSLVQSFRDSSGS